MIGAIDLTLQEKELADCIKFQGVNSDEYAQNCDNVLKPMARLEGRNAIPEQRLRYFTDKDYKFGGRSGNSWREIIIKNDRSGDNVYTNPSFLKFLHYFLYGANLQELVIAEFSEKVRACGRVGPSDALDLGNVARKMVREHGLSACDAAEEFYKLALDCDVFVSHAIRIGEAVK